MIPSRDEDRLLLTPGPTPVHRDILDALALPTISHTSAQFAETMKRTLSGLKDIAGLAQGEVFAIAGSGTLAQEIAIVNFVEPGDVLLVASNGFFATRMHAIAQQHDIPVALREARPGTSITPPELRSAIEETGATAVAFTHVETSTGVMAPLAEFTEVVRECGALSIVDGVAGFGGVPEPMGDLGVDVLLTGSQKALGVPPGLAIIAAGPMAWAKREARTDKLPAFYADLARWCSSMQQPEKYFSTHPVNLIQALAKAVEIVLREGLEARYRRHEQLAAVFRQGLSDLRFEPFTDSAFLAPTLSAVCAPEGIASSELRRRLHANGVIAAAGLGDKQDRIVRFGHMGNISDAEIAVALDAIRRSLAGD